MRGEGGRRGVGGGEDSYTQNTGRRRKKDGCKIEKTETNREKDKQTDDSVTQITMSPQTST